MQGDEEYTKGRAPHVWEFNQPTCPVQACTEHLKKGNSLR